MTDNMKYCLVLWICLSGFAGCKQKSNVQNTTPKNQEKEVTTTATKGEIGIAFYNVENLFDAEDDPKINDEEFTPSSKLNWTEDKYKIKSANMAKVISQLAEDGPEIFGLVEVENAGTVRDLLNQTTLKAHNYKFVHQDSKDERGIDVALCYDPAVFKMEKFKAFTPKFSASDKKTRDFLVVEGKLNGEPTYFIVNHWPSRREGQAESEIYRVEVARQVKRVCDSITKKVPSALICLMGDFNDDPVDKSIKEVFDAKGNPSEASKGGYFNPMLNLYKPELSGTLEYQGKWNVFDQLIMSKTLSDSKSKVQYVENSATIFSPEWLRVGYGKAKESPRRSVFRDEFRDDGYSDHFPVYMKWNLK